MYFVQIILVVTMAAKAASQCLQIKSNKGNKLIGHAFKTDSGIDLLKCFQECKAHEQCQSINFKSIESVCEFNNRTREARPSYFVPEKEWLYFDNPYKTLIGSSRVLPGRSCKEIRDNAAGSISLSNKEYWINPSSALTPISVYCDMKTDGGGWTLIAQTLVKADNDTIESMIRENDYNLISNYSVNNLRIDVPAIGKLRQDMGFSQLRYFCRKKTVGRTFHIITRKNENGRNVVDYFTKDHLQQRKACESYFLGTGDDSVLASNCTKWGNDGKHVEIGEWGYYQHNGTFRIYNDPAYWNGTKDKYFVNFVPEYLCCDEDRYKVKHLSKDDVWQIYVR